MSRWVRFLSVMPLFTCTSCLEGIVWRIDYEFAVSAGRQDEGKEVALRTGSRGRKVDLIADDHMASFSFRVRPGGIDVDVRNKAKTQLHLRAEDARFVDPEGREHELYVACAGNPGQARGHECEPTTLVPPGSEVQIFLWPRDWLSGEYEGRPSTYKCASPIDGREIVGRTPHQARGLVQGHLGRAFEILLPVEQDGTRYLYRFRFMVKDIHLDAVGYA